MYTKKKGIQITLKPRQKAKTSRNSFPLILTNHTIITIIKVYEKTFDSKNSKPKRKKRIT